jgi:hypothetical protein
MANGDDQIPPRPRVYITGRPPSPLDPDDPSLRLPAGFGSYPFDPRPDLVENRSLETPTQLGLRTFEDRFQNMFDPEFPVRAESAALHRAVNVTPLGAALGLEDLPLKPGPAIPDEAKKPLPSDIAKEEARIKEVNKKYKQSKGKK